MGAFATSILFCFDTWVWIARTKVVCKLVKVLDAV